MKKEKPSKLSAILKTKKVSDLSEMTIGKLKLSFYPKDTLVMIFGDNGDDMTMLNSHSAQQLVDFLQLYLDSFKAKE